MTDQSERLAKLVMMLSSDQPGEVVSAARAIGRALRTVGQDWHALAARLSTPTKARTGRQARHDERGADWWAMREYCLQHDTLLRPREREFVVNLGTWRGELTEKQLAWLVAIYERLRRSS